MAQGRSFEVAGFEPNRSHRGEVSALLHLGLLDMPANLTAAITSIDGHPYREPGPKVQLQSVHAAKAMTHGD